MSYTWIYVICVSLIGSKSGQNLLYSSRLFNYECLHLGVICYFFFDGDNQWKAMKPESLLFFFFLTSSFVFLSNDLIQASAFTQQKYFCVPKCRDPKSTACVLYINSLFFTSVKQQYLKQVFDGSDRSDLMKTMKRNIGENSMCTHDCGYDLNTHVVQL